MSHVLDGLDAEERELYTVIYEMCGGTKGVEGREELIDLTELVRRSRWDEERVLRVMRGIEEKTGLVTTMEYAGEA